MKNQNHKKKSFLNLKKERITHYDLYNKCNILPIHNFNEASNGDLSFLQVNKNEEIPEYILQETWIEIMDEYLKISNSALTLSILGEKLKSVYLISQLKVYQSLKNCFENEIDVTELLKKYRIKPENINQKIALVKNDFNQLFTKEKEGKNESDNSNFEMSLAMIRKEGYSIDRFKMVVTEWCAILNQIEKQQRIAQKNGKTN